MAPLARGGVYAGWRGRICLSASHSVNRKLYTLAQSPDSYRPCLLSKTESNPALQGREI